MMGLGANVATAMSITDSVFSGNNRERFKWAPVSGGVKITKSEGVTIRGNVFTDNLTAGLWFDDSSYNVTITGNVVRRNATLGILVEATDKVVVADNYVHDNGKGIVVFNAGNVNIWNNTLVGNSRTLEFMQDERRQINAALVSRIPWVTRNVTINNNVLAYGTAACPFLTQDLTKTWFGNDFGLSMDGNIYHRASESSPSNFACWANGRDGTRSFKTLASFRAHTGKDAASASVQGPAVVDAALSITPAASRAVGLAPRALPAGVAASIGVAAGTTNAGALTGYAASDR